MFQLQPINLYQLFICILDPHSRRDNYIGLGYLANDQLKYLLEELFVICYESLAWVYHEDYHFLELADLADDEVEYTRNVFILSLEVVFDGTE